MRKHFILGLSVFLAGLASAENVANVERMVCASGQAKVCFETGECYSATPWELSVPDFVIIDTAKGTITTTEASEQNRSTEFSKSERSEGRLYVQGIEDGRAFSFVIHEATGRMTAAISRDGLTVTVFGACTDTDL